LEVTDPSTVPSTRMAPSAVRSPRTTQDRPSMFSIASRAGGALAGVDRQAMGLSSADQPGTEGYARFMAAWDDAQYLKFGDERTRAARELLARVPLDQAGRVIDLGCGPGNSTALLRDRWPCARVTGVDS